MELLVLHMALSIQALTIGLETINTWHRCMFFCT